MKQKLTLSIRDKIIRKMKRDAGMRGKSLSGHIEDLAMRGTVLPDKKKSALQRLLKRQDKAPAKKTLSRKQEEEIRYQHLVKKYG